MIRLPHNLLVLLPEPVPLPDSPGRGGARAGEGLTLSALGDADVQRVQHGSSYSRRRDSRRTDRWLFGRRRLQRRLFRRRPAGSGQRLELDLDGCTGEPQRASVRASVKLNWIHIL